MSETTMAENVVNEPSKPVPRPALNHRGAPLQNRATTYPRMHAPTQLTTRVDTGNSFPACGTSQSTQKRSAVPSAPPTATATKSAVRASSFVMRGPFALSEMPGAGVYVALVVLAPLGVIDRVAAAEVSCTGLWSSRATTVQEKQ
jgi:hypothetical protein